MLVSEHILRRTINCSNNGLNPCFSGCWFLRNSVFLHFKNTSYVLILVFLDVGFWEEPAAIGRKQKRLNPCFSGCWFLRFKTVILWMDKIFVLILVFLDVGFWENCRSSWSSCVCRSLNPCFSGCWFLSRTLKTVNHYLAPCLNPCFSGCWFLRRFRSFHTCSGGSVLILVFLDVGFWVRKHSSIKSWPWGS